MSEDSDIKHLRNPLLLKNEVGRNFLSCSSILHVSHMMGFKDALCLRENWVEIFPAPGRIMI